MKINGIKVDFENMSTKQLRNWVNNMPEPYASMARVELVKRGEAL